MVSSKLFSWTMQFGMKVLVLQDRLFGNQIVSLDGDSSPFPLLEKLRSKGNILRTYMINGWCVVSHEDVKVLLREKRLSSQVFDSKLLQGVIRSATRGLVAPLIDYPSMLNMDAPDHTRLRKLASQGFTNRFVQSLAPKVEAIVSEQLSVVEGKAAFDVMDVVAKPLPAIVIAEMLGVPPEDRHRFEAWSSDLLGYTEILDANAIYKAAEGDLALRAYLQDLVEHKRTHPAQDLISSMIEAEEGDDKLTVDELLSTATLLLVAGHETTTRLIGNCLLRLLENPDQLAEVREDRALLGNAIEESLRLDPPVLALSRIVSESFDYQGVCFKKGQTVMFSIAGANRDPAATDAPDSFSVHRKSFDHLSFGHGIHQCLGMPLARLEAKVTLNRMLDLYPNLGLSGKEVVWDNSPFFRGPQALEVRVN